MIFLYRISVYICDEIKSDAWILWERRYTWFNCREVYKNFESAYSAVKLHERTHDLLKNVKERQ